MSGYKYSLGGRVMAPVYRLEAIDELSPTEGDPLNLLSTSNQRMICALQLDASVVFEIATEFNKDGFPTKWVAVVLKPGEALQFAQDVQHQASRAVDYVVHHKDTALKDWAEMQRTIQGSRKK